MGKKGFVPALVAASLAGATWLFAGNDKPETPSLYSLPAVTLGQGELSVNASLRVRYEYFDNVDVKRYGTAGDDELLQERLWVDVKYSVDRSLEFFLRIQDAHFWLSRYDESDFPTHSPYQNPVDIRELYGQWNAIGDTSFGSKIGRQVIRYGDERIWGPGAWCSSGKFTWDAAKLLWRTDTLDADILWGRRVVADADDMDRDYFDYHVGGLYASFKDLPFEADIFSVTKWDDDGNTPGESGTNDLSVCAVGTRLYRAFPGGVDLGGTVVGQFGDWGNDSVRAFGLHSALGYTVPREWSPRISVQYTYGSGDSDPADGVHETFDAMFGACAKFYGRMNLFGWMNLQDYQVDVSLRPPLIKSLLLSYHHFELADTADAWYSAKGKAVHRDPTGRSGADVGREIDLVLKCVAWHGLELEAGYGHFFPGRFAESMAGGDDADWVFIQTSASL